MTQYPWYTVVNEDAIEQGDIFRGCPVYLPPDELAADLPTEEAKPAYLPSGELAAELPTEEAKVIEFECKERNVIVLSQTCDLVKGREKVTEVLLCALWDCRNLKEGHLATARGKEDARRGNLPAYHMLAACEIPELGLFRRRGLTRA